MRRSAGSWRLPRLGLLTGLVTLLAGAPAALAIEAEPTREEYVQRVDPICKRSNAVSERTHREATRLVRRKAYRVAGKRVLSAARTFSRSLRQIAKVPRPPADQPRLKKWLDHLKEGRSLLFEIARELSHSRTTRVSRLESRGNHVKRQANALVVSFEFKYCTKQT